MSRISISSRSSPWWARTTSSGAQTTPILTASGPSLADTSTPTWARCRNASAARSPARTWPGSTTSASVQCESTSAPALVGLPQSNPRTADENHAVTRRSLEGANWPPATQRVVWPGVVGTVPTLPFPGVTPLGGFALPGVVADRCPVATPERLWAPGEVSAAPRPAPTETPLGGGPRPAPTRARGPPAHPYRHP